MAVIEGRDGDDWDDHAPDADGEPLETEQLALADEDDRLPWLESSDDDDYDDDGSDNSGMIKLLVGGILALAVLIGGIWWVSHRNSDPTLVADGSVVPAEPGPYKEAPKDPGGKQFDGTGDSSFAVSEGQNRPAQLGGADKSPPLPAPANPDPSAKPGVATGPAAPTGGVGVQVGAFSSKASAEAGWAKLVAQSNGALSGVSHRVIEGSADNGTIFRLQAVAGDAAAANSLCGRLKGAGIACQVK